MKRINLYPGRGIFSDISNKMIASFGSDVRRSFSFPCSVTAFLKWTVYLVCVKVLSCDRCMHGASCLASSSEVVNVWKNFLLFVSFCNKNVLVKRKRNGLECIPRIILYSLKSYSVQRNSSTFPDPLISLIMWIFIKYGNENTLYITNDDWNIWHNLLCCLLPNCHSK